jgi:HJR/Mrr/RecB family endonuclease
MPFLPFLIGIGIVIVAIQRIAENAPIAGATFAVLVLLTTIFLWNLSAKKKALQEATRRAIISEFKWTDSIGPFEFERRCAEAMQFSGWIAQTTKSTGDQGADVIASKRGIKVNFAVQVVFKYSWE